MARQLPQGAIGSVTLKDGTKLDVFANDGFRGFLRDLDGVTATSQVRVGSIISGYATKSQLQLEAGQRVSGDAANGGAGDGTGTSNSGTYSNISVTSASWVEAKGLLVTPTGPPGTYSFTISADIYLDQNVTISDSGSFNGLWRIVEKRVSDSATTTIASGTFAGTFHPEENLPIEGDFVTVPASVSVAFSGLPSSPVAATYSTTQTRLQFEFSRASGSNTISGMYGSFAVAWSA